MKLHLRMPLVVSTRRVSAILLSLALGTWSSFTLPQVSKALGIDAGSIGATGGMLDCSDSGVLVATAGPGKRLGTCPLKHTDVQASVSGYVARVTVKQQFHNPFKQKIEAVYTFPMPDDAAVDEMTMRIGNRVIKGTIKKKDDARQTYETARAQGQVASLLDQERPNIFTQSVANIEPGQNIDIEIHYVNILKYENGSFSFVFPTVVGPRFIPGHTNDGRSGTGTAYDTESVPDASKISPIMKQEGERAGHDISINLDINAGVPIQTVASKLHEIDLTRPTANTAHVSLKNKDKIPNKDFIATWNVAADSIQSGYLTHKKGNEGFFTLMLIPPKKVTPSTVQPKEMVFLLDCSGSQRGLPIEKAKETMEYIVDHMNPKDTFQVVTFNNEIKFLSETPQLASQSLREKAKEFIKPIYANGGTWAEPAVEKVCSLPSQDNRLRVVTFMTDGYVGNDMQVIDTVKRFRGKSRWFTFGTGNSVNRFMIDSIAKEGGGEADYVLLNSSAEEVGKKFYDRISSPVLTDVKVEFDGLEVKDVFPKEPADVWAQRPVYITGRYTKGGTGKVILRGFSGGKPYKQELKITLPEDQNANDVLPSIWARAKVDRLMSEDWRGVQYGTFKSELKEEVEQTALKYHIMSQFTSFVAVEEDRKTAGGEPVKMAVPVESPEGVSTDALRQSAAYRQKSMSPLPRAQYSMGQAGTRYGARAAGGGGGGGGNGWSSGPVGFNGSSGAASQSYGLPMPTPSSVTTKRSASFQHYNHYEVHPSMQSRGMMLPQTAMGNFVASPGNSTSAYGASGSANSAPSASPMFSRERSQSAPSWYSNAKQPMPTPPSASSSQNKPKLSINEERPIVRDFREMQTETKSDKGKGRLSKDKEQFAQSQAEDDKTQVDRPLPARSKIDSKLQDAIGRKLKHPNESQTLRIKIVLSNSPGSDFLDKLNKAGLKIDKREGKNLIGNIDAKLIQKLLEFPEIQALFLASK